MKHADEVVDLRPALRRYEIGVRTQGGRGTCSVHAMALCVEFVLKKSGRGRDALSVEYLNWAKNAVANTHKDGDFFDRIDAGYRKYGIATESDAPYRASYEPDVPPPDDIIARSSAGPRLDGRFLKPWSYQPVTDAQHDAILAALRSGVPVAGGFRWPKSGKEKLVRSGRSQIFDQIPEPDVYDGHSVGLIGFRVAPELPGGGAFLIRNSWGEGWGERGNGWISFAYARVYLNDAFVYSA